MGKRIIVESGAYGLHNLGDIAMMQTAVERIAEFWPSAQVEVVTYRPDLLARFCPSAIPLQMKDRSAWLRSRNLAIGLQRKLPLALSRQLVAIERAIWLRLPRAANLAVWVKSKLRKREFISPETFRRRLKSANLLVVNGMGGLNDTFATEVAIPLLDEMEAALEAGVPVIAFGQGIGPIDNPLLLERARAVLPRLRIIALREGVTGLPLLEALGVSRERVVVTGDDAIEMAFKLRPSVPGDAVGVNLRLAEYAGTNDETADKLSGTLHSIAAMSKRPLIPIPIAFGEIDSDVRAIESLLGNSCRASFENLRSPEDAIRLIGNCKVVVTGSYHGGVFALSQGIPIVALIQSPYYEQKFKGLEAQFPGGCRLLDFRTSVSAGEIRDAILAALESADEVRESLLVAAEKQVQLGREAYRTARRLCSLAS